MDQMKFLRVYFGDDLSHTEISQERSMINHQGSRKKKNIPVTISAKDSLSRTNRKIQTQYSKWLGIHKFWKQLLNIPEVTPKGE